LKKRKKILIVGGTGFIGFHLASQLVKKNYIVTSLSTKLPTKKRKVSRASYLICDICKFNQLKKILNKNKEFDYVINLGGYVDHSNKKKTFKSHYIGCKNLANYFLKKKIKRFIQLGSSVEYGNSNSPQIENRVTEEKKLKSTYGIAKLKATNFLLQLFKKNNFPVTILRLYLAYGPNQDVNRFLPIIITNCLLKKKFPCSNGIQYRDFLYIDDLVNLIEKLLNSKKLLNGQIFNAGSGKPQKLKTIIKLIVKKLNGGIPEYGKVKLRKDEIIKLYPNIKKVKLFTSWRPKITFKNGLKKTILYYEEKFT
jgi:UDP-glucose 4-epimerase